MKTAPPFGLMNWPMKKLPPSDASMTMGSAISSTVPRRSARMSFSFSILLVTLYGRGGELSFVFPVIYGGAIALTAVIGWIALGDAFTWTRLGGVVGIVIGIGLLALPTS